MGYYIPNGQPIENLGAEQTRKPNLLSEVQNGKALICQVDNGHFKANGLIYSERELEDFSEPSDRRPKKWFLMDEEIAHKLSGYKK